MLDIERKYELEEALEKTQFPRLLKSEMTEIAINKLNDYIKNTGLPDDEVEYLKIAYYMPMNAILNDIKIYEKDIYGDSSEVMNTLDFIKNLAEKYGVTEYQIIKRIREVININEYKKSIKRKKKGSK